ncbi:MAG: AlpA family transcriptional regulator [Betaproteobacteria bacterium]|nr:AlpA family transcriptional regulator [Betaproteobacteria bacterium]
MSDPSQQGLSILRRKQVEARTGLARSTIYHHIKAGTFPRPVPLGPRAVGWLESDVSNWIAERVALARDNTKRFA